MTFKDKVCAVVCTIPKGKVATYGQIARLAGSAQAGRAVGTVMSKNENPKVVPCHRVVASDGRLAGYAFGTGLATKKKILLHEGVHFKENKVDLTKSLWNR